MRIKTRADSLPKRFIAFAMLLLMLFASTACNWLPNNDGPLDIDVSPSSTPIGSMINASTHTYAVSTSNKIATQVGMKILEAGGNAVDAAIAVAYTLAVVQPYASGLGGGGCLLLYNPAENEYAFYDYFPTMRFTSKVSRNYIGVPGFVKGLYEVYNDYASVDFSALVAPAIEYAQNGTEVTEDLEVRIRVAWANLKDNKNFYDENGNRLEQGDILYQPELAETIRILAEKGADAFYRGEIAEQIANMQGADITMQDLASYSVHKTNPVISDFMGYEIASAPAPFAGITIIQMLRMAEALDIANPGENPVTYLDQLYEITSRAYTDRIDRIADPDFTEIDQQYLVSADHIAELLNMDYVDLSDDYEHVSTTHFTIIDENGMVVSSTNTLSSFWGSRKHVAGIYMNDTCKHFASSGINQSDYGKTPRTYCSPVIIRGDDGFILSIGTPGGNNIPKILVPVLIDYLKFGTDLQEAIFKGRVFSKNHNTIVVEEREFFPLITNVELKEVNYYFIRRDDATYFGSIAAVGYSPKLKRVFSAYDDRRGGTSVSSFEG